MFDIILFYRHLKKNLTHHEEKVLKQHLWKKEKIKTVQCKGGPYINVKGKTIAAKFNGPDCMCKKKCMKKLDTHVQPVILSNFYNGRPKNEMDTFICGLITRKDIAKHRTDSKIYSSSFK